MPKKILVIGAGVAQVDAIIKAKEIGYEIYTSDGDSRAPGFKQAHGSKVIDVKDVVANLSWAENLGIDGVISYASDITLSTVLAIRERLNLPGLGRLPMEVSLDKSRQRIIFAKNKLPQPNFEVITNYHEAQKAANCIGYPLILKPVDNSGSRGVGLIENEGELETGFAHARQNSKCGTVIIEKCEGGLELTIEGLSVNGKHYILAISDKEKPLSAPTAATQLAYPADITTDQENQVKQLICSAYDAVGVDNTPTHSEIILTESGLKIVEIGCRGGGFYVFTRVVEAASGYDVVGNWTRLCAGDPVEHVQVQTRGVVLRFMIANPGKLLKVHGLESACAIEGVAAGSFYSPGNLVPEFSNDGSRSGWMITTGRNRDDALRKANQVSQLVHFETKPG